MLKGGRCDKSWPNISGGYNYAFWQTIHPCKGSDSMTVKLFQYTLVMQGLYYLLTAVWPLVDIESFMEVTGPKTDIWLVKTVAALLLPISVCLIASAYTRSGFWPVSILAGGSSAALFLIDFYYAGDGTISKIYMADGIIEIVFVIIWIYIMTRLPTVSQTYTK